MARHDTVHLYGCFAKAEIKKDENGTPYSAVLHIDCVRGKRYVDDHTDKMEMRDRIPVKTGDVELINKIADMEENDIVFVKGTVSTATGNKKIKCEHCGSDYEYSYLYVTVTAIDLMVVKKFDNREDALEDLYNHREFSNELLAIGVLRKNPNAYKTKRGVILAEYQLNIERKFRIVTDDPAKKHDDPWIKVYGALALDNLLRLSGNSEVLIDGFIQSRQVKKTFKCPHCGEFIFDKGHVLEIVPYAIEYLKDCMSDKDFAEEGIDTAEKKQEIYDRVTNEKDG